MTSAPTGGTCSSFRPTPADRIRRPISFDHARLGWLPADRPARLRIAADAYGLDADRRAELVDAVDDALDRIESVGRGNAATGYAEVLAVIERTGGLAKYDRRRRWWARHGDAFVDALR